MDCYIKLKNTMGCKRVMEYNTVVMPIGQDGFRISSIAGNEVVENILRDKESGWAYDYYKDDGKSSMDVAIAKAKREEAKRDQGDVVTLEYKKFLEEKRFLLIQNIRNTFIINGDLEYLIREVKRVEEYVAGLR